MHIGNDEDEVEKDETMRKAFGEAGLKTDRGKNERQLTLARQSTEIPVGFIERPDISPTMKIFTNRAFVTN